MSALPFFHLDWEYFFIDSRMNNHCSVSLWDSVSGQKICLICSRKQNSFFFNINPTRVRELCHIAELYLCPIYNAKYIHHIHTSHTPISRWCLLLSDDELGAQYLCGIYYSLAGHFVWQTSSPSPDI